MPVPAWSFLQPAVMATVALGEAALLAVAPDGGQRGARRNAWVAMAENAARARARREAWQALGALDAPSGTSSAAAR